MESVLDCDYCGTEHEPSCYAETLIPSPSGSDLFGPWTCHECGGHGIIAFNMDAFMEAYHMEMAERIREKLLRETMEVHKQQSQIGRDVAEFRKVLADVASVEDITWTL